MLVKVLAVTVLALAALLPFQVSADAPWAADAIVGRWLIASKDAVIDIHAAESPDPGPAEGMTGDEYHGSIAWLLDKTYDEKDGPALNGKPLLDHRNPDPALRTRPLLGLPMLKGLRFDGQNHWLDGRVYSCNDGRTYRVQVSLADRDHLNLRGYFGLPIFGMTSVWTRIAALPSP